jgi:hypothetical protein
VRAPAPRRGGARAGFRPLNYFRSRVAPGSDYVAFVAYGASISVHQLACRGSLAGVVVLIACAVGADGGAAAPARVAAGADPPIFVPWRTVGNITLGERRARVERRYGSAGHGYHVPFGNRDQGYYLLHGSKVWVTFDRGRVAAIRFTSRYYRTREEFGVGSAIPLGRCHRTDRFRCEHRWHGFVWNEWNRDRPCTCWTKAGLGAESLPLTAANFLKPWFFINMRRGRVASFYFDLAFVD